jgi:hypothetical protein
MPLLPNGTIRTESTRSLAFRPSSDTISTQWRVAPLAVSSPRFAVQISPRLGPGLLAKISLTGHLRDGGLETQLFFGDNSFERPEVSSRVLFQTAALFCALGSQDHLVNGFRYVLDTPAFHKAMEITMSFGIHRR